MFLPPLIPVYNKNSSFPIQLVCISYMTKSLDMYYWNNEGAGLAGVRLKMVLLHASVHKQNPKS